MIIRIWHGWTVPANADSYEHLLRTAVFPDIAKIKGYQGIELLRRDTDGLVEFVTLMRFETFEGVVAFAGENYERAFVPVEAQALLHDYDLRATHFEVRMRRKI